MADIKGNNKQVYDYLSSVGAQGIGNNADEFQKFMENDDNRRQIYDYLSSSNAQGMGNSYEEFSSFVYDGGKKGENPQPVQAQPVRSEAKKRTDRFNAMARRRDEQYGYTPGAEDPETEAKTKELIENRSRDIKHEELAAMVEPRKENVARQEQQKRADAAEGYQMFQEMGAKKGIKPLGEKVVEYAKEREELPGANVEGKTVEELDEIRSQMGLEYAFKDEYEKKKAEYAEHMKEYSNVRGDARGVDFSKYEDERKWLKDNERRYNDVKGRVDNVQSKMLELASPELGKENDEAMDEIQEAMKGQSTNNAISYGPGGFASYANDMSSSEVANYSFADEISHMTKQVLNQGSKYDKGYEGGELEKAYTAVSQFLGGAINEVDMGTITMGASEGSALIQARRVGDKYNTIITDTIKDLGYTDRDVERMMGDLEKKTKELEPLAKELEQSEAEIKTMEATLDDMIKNGADEKEVRAYANDLSKKINAHNKKIKDSESTFADYKKTKDKYDEVAGAVEAAIQAGISPGEEALLSAIQRYTKAKYLRKDDVSKAAAAGAGFENTLEYMLGFAMTGALEKAGTKLATKMTMRHLEKKLGKEGLKDLVTKGAIKTNLGYKFLTDTGVAAARTAALPTRYVQTLGEQMAEYSDIDKFGRLQFDRSKANAAGNALYQSFVENWSEGFGTYLSAGEQALFRKVMGRAPELAIGQTLKGFRGSIGNYLDNAKFDGQLNEMLEEVGGSLLNSIGGWLSSAYNKVTGNTGPGIGDKDAITDFFKGEQLATTFLSFLPLSAIGAATNISAYNRMARQYDESVAKLNPLIESGAIDAKELDDLAGRISGMTPKEAIGEIKKMADKARPKNGDKLPSDFAKSVLGYIEGKYAMDLRHDEWERSQEKMSVVEAYSTAYENANLNTAWDLKENEQQARSLASDAGFSDDELDHDAYILAQEAAQIRETEPDRSKALLDYAVAKASESGFHNRYREEGRKNEEEYDAAVRQNLDRDGIIISATMQVDGQPKTVYITTKGVKIGKDGTISTPTGVDGPVLYREDAESVEQGKVMASQLTNAEIVPTENFIQQRNAAYAESRAQELDQAEKTVSLAGRARAISDQQGNTVVVRRNGVYQPVKVERMTKGGLGVVISGDKKALQGVAAAMGMQVPASQYLEAPVERLYPLLSKEEDNSLTTMVPEGAPTQMEERPEVEIVPDTEYMVNINGVPTKVDVDQVTDTEVWYNYKDGEGNQKTGYMAPYEFQEKLVPEQAAAQAVAQEAAPETEYAKQQAAQQARQAQMAQQNTTAFPVDEKTGNKVYDHPSVSPQAAFDEIFRGVEPGTKNEANRNKFVASKAAQAAQAVTEAQNRVAGLQAKRAMVDEWDLPDGEELDAFEARKDAERKKFDDEIAAVQAEIPELERRAAHWASVNEMSAARAQAERARAQAETEEQKPKRTPKTSKRARVARAKQWEKRTGVKVKIATTPKEVDNKDARKALGKGEIVYGWYDKDTNTVGLYLPYLTDEEEIDKTFIHEVISHKGLRDLLGEEEYDKLCDKVWNKLMSDEKRKEYLAYNSHLEGSEEYLRRAAADEFIANISEDLDVAENRNLFEQFVDWVKEILDRWFAEDTRTPEEIAADAKAIASKESISRADLFDLLKSSLSNYEAIRRAEKKKAEAKPMTTEALPEEVQKEMAEKGEVMDGGTVMDAQQGALKEATGYKTPNELDMESNPVVGDVRMSKTTIPAWARNYMTYPDAKEHVVKVLENLTERMSTDQLVNWIVPGGVYKYGEKTSGSKAGPLRTNIEYIVTFDMDTSCPRSLQYLEYVKRIEAQIGRPLTQTEMIQLIEMMRVYGQMIPCVYCYCENKRQALKQYYHDFMTARRGVITAKNEEEALAAMYGHEVTKAARESKDPAVALTEAAYKVFKKWRSGDVKYNPTLKQLWSQYRNDRNVILTVLDDMLEAGRINTLLTDTTIAKHLCKELRIENSLAQKAAEDLVGEWKWNRIEDRPHDDFKRVEDEDDLVVGEETLALWREMTAYGKSASQAKNILRYVPYTDELKTLGQEDRDYINGMGGLRMHSSNDFRIDYVLDYFQFMADMAVNHMFGHTYTKSPEFVRIFGNSGYKINMSIAAYEDSRGIHPNPQEGFDWNEAKELREKFPNAGVMLMATSDAQVQMALDSDWIDMFIPFHASGLPKAVWYNMRHWTDYSSTQNERFLNGTEMREALEADGVDVPKDASAEEVEQMYIDHFHIRVERYTTGKKAGKRISPHFLPGETIVDGVKIPGHHNDYETYISLCREWGVHPRFYGLKVKDNTPEGAGREVDITEHPAYMKCIKETARTDTPQTAIEFNFDQPSEALGGMTPIDYAMEELQARAAEANKNATEPVRNIYESYKDDPYGIVPQFIDGIIKHKEETGKDYPLDYLTPDSRKWAMTERKALEDAYKEFDTIPYHPHEYDADGNLIMEPEKDTAPVVANEGGESGTMLRKRSKPAPKNTKTGYAAFAVLQGGDGKYYLQPKMVQVEGQGTPVLTWLDADTGEIRRDKDGNMVTNTKGRIKVQDSSINKRGGSSKGQGLAWRPGKHLAEYPNATQFAVANPVTGVKDVMQDNIVFFEVSYAADKDYQTEAWEYGFDENGNYNHSQAGLPYIPVDGYYKYRTNVNPDIPAMIITGAFKIERALTDAEAKDLNQKAGGTWLERESGKPVDEDRLRELGFAEDQLEERRDEYDFSAIEEGRDESAEVMKLEGYTPHAIDFDNENLKAAAKENDQDIDTYREGYQSPEERGWDRGTYTGESGARFRVAERASELLDGYNNQDGIDNPWMSESELIDKIEEELPYEAVTKNLFSKIDEYKRLDEEDFNEGRRDFSGSDRDAVFQEILSELETIGKSEGNRFREVTSTPEFKNWFKDSKVVDKNGEPLVVYHGSRSTKDFSVFDYDADTDKAIGSGTKPAFFFSDKRTADAYKQNINLGTLYEGEGREFDVYLSIQNPQEIDYEGARFDGVGYTAEQYSYLLKKWIPLENKANGSTLKYFPTEGAVIDEYRRQHPFGRALEEGKDYRVTKVENAKPKVGEFVDGIDRNVNDGSIIRNIYEVDGITDDYVAFEPTQIKSATDNNGQFDSNNPDIRFREVSREERTKIDAYDKYYNTDVGGFLDYVKSGWDGSSKSWKVAKIKKSGFPTLEDAARHGKLPVVGDLYVDSDILNPRRHSLEDNPNHQLTQEEWARVIDFLAGDNPKIIATAEANNLDAFTLYPPFRHHNGLPMAVIVEQMSNTKQSKKAYIITAFGEHDEVTKKKHFLYGSYEKVKGIPMVHAYRANPAATTSWQIPSESKGNDISETSKENLNNNTLLRKAAPATEEERRIEVAEQKATVQGIGTMEPVIKSGVEQVSREQMPAGHKTDKGYYDQDANNVYICADNIADERDAVATVIHETVGYKGLQEIFGEQFGEMMTRVYAALDNDGRAFVNAYITRNGLRPGDAAIIRGMEEYLARRAESDGGSNLGNINEVLSKVVGELFGVADFEFTDNELAYILRASYEHSVNPDWLNTPAGRAKNTLMKRELGINETDPNKPTDPNGGTRFRREDSGIAAEDYAFEVQRGWNKLVTENQNADLPVKIGIEKAMKEVGKTSLGEEEDYLTRHNVASSRADTEYHNFRLFHYQPMVDKVNEIVKKLAGRGASRAKLLENYERVIKYLYAVSGLERNEWERNNGGELKDWSGLTSLMGFEQNEWEEAEKAARQMVEDFKNELGDDAALGELWDLIRSCTDFSLEHAYKYGLLSRTEYERLHGTASKPRMWNYYLPLRGFGERTAEQEFDYAGLAGQGESGVVEKAKGRWTVADNPLAYIDNIAQREIVQGNENWARQALLRFTINLGKNSLLSERSPWYEKVTVDGKDKWMLASPREVDPVTGNPETIERFEERMQEMKAEGKARQGRQGLELSQIMANKGNKHQHLIHVKIGGSDRMIWVNGDPAMARAISGYGKKDKGDVEKAVRAASRVLSNLFTTYSLDFTAKNFIRDTTYSIVALHMKEDKAYRHQYAKNWIKNFGYGGFAFPMIKLAAEWDSGKLQRKENLTEREQQFIEFMTNGGQTGYTVVRSVEKLKDDLKKTIAPKMLRKIGDATTVDLNGIEVPLLHLFTFGVRTLNEAFELLTRFTTYQTSRDMGRSGQRAAYDAKEISVNFNRKGAQSGEGIWGQIASYLGATHYFYNAGVQGFDNFLRLYKADPKKMSAASVLIMTMGIFTPFINSMLAGAGSGSGEGGNDDWYWNLPEWVRRNNIVLGFKNWYLALPLPVELRALYGMGDITASAFAYQKMPNRTFGRVAGDIVSTAAAILPFNPIEDYSSSGNLADALLRSAVPDITMPIVDIATNRDYTGRALVKENPFTKVVPKSQGAYASTPKALVEACQWLGETAGIDVAPGIVRDILSNYAGGPYHFAEDIAKQVFTDADRPRRWDDIPFLSGFTGHIDEDRSNTYVNNVLNEYQRVSQKVVLGMNLRSVSSDITEKQAYENPETLPAGANSYMVLHKKEYELGKMYYEGMKDKGTGEYRKVPHVVQSGKNKGKIQNRKEEIKIPGVNTLRKKWKDAREYWTTLPKGSPEAAEAYKDVTNAWHEYYNAQADLAEKMLNFEYGK